MTLSHAIQRYRTKMAKESVYIYFFELTNIITYFSNGFFPEELAIAEVFPIFKKKENLVKVNYRPIIFSHIC